MMQVDAFDPSDLDGFVAQPWQDGEAAYADAMLVEEGPAFTVRCGGRVAGIFGLVYHGPTYRTGWGAVSADAGGAGLLALTRAMRGVLAAVLAPAGPVIRVDLLVRSGFAQGHRWADMLGFFHEGTVHRLHGGPDDYDLFAVLGEDA